MNKFVCKQCGDENYYLKEIQNGTGIATGVYCTQCGSWQKWAGKKELTELAKNADDYLKVQPKVQSATSAGTVTLQSSYTFDRSVVMDLIESIERQLGVLKKMVGSVPSITYPSQPFPPGIPSIPEKRIEIGDIFPNPYEPTCVSSIAPQNPPLSADDDTPPWE